MKLKELFESTGKSVTDLGIEYDGNGDFYCTREKLTSLEGSPRRVGGNFNCPGNRLVNLKGGPDRVARDFNCMSNKLTSLEGAPSYVGHDFYALDNKLKSLKDIHKHISELHGDFHGYSNPLKSNVLGLLLIKGLKRVLLDNMQVQNILNKHLGKGRVGMLQAQEELIEAGLEEFAQL